MVIDRKKIRQAIRLIIEGIGEDPQREGLAHTPDRVARMYEDIFSGVGTEPAEKLSLFTSENHDEMILMKDIPFYSMCEHHLLPFWGHVSIGYIPGNNQVTGFSSLVRLVEAFAKRPQVQERMTTELADILVSRLKPLGVIVIIKAKHLCISMQGVKKEVPEIVTSAQRGYLRKQITRLEAISLINSK
ncbi:MAG: GTP cyclohydrolase I FolE [Candidatus Hatepunaea meridiana]|nr:GTP cyclohydrolase I FolE [Candidatus Hatepunaea meridiana]